MVKCMLWKSCFKYVERFFISFFAFFRNFFLERPGFTKIDHFLNENSCSQLYIISLQITKRILTTDTFHWLELLSVILSFLKIFSLKWILLFFFYTVFQKIYKKIKFQMAYFGKIGQFLLTSSTSYFLNDF